MNLPFFRLFVLGAGFSKPAGLPLAKELLSLIRRAVKRHFEIRGNWEGTLEQEIREWTALYPGVQVDLERVLAYSHRKHYLRLLGSDEHFEHGSRSIVAARRAIQRILVEATPKIAPPLYVEFVQSLSPNDLVLTFNYDTLLEQTFESVGKPYSLTPEWWLSVDKQTSGQKYVDLVEATRIG